MKISEFHFKLWDLYIILDYIFSIYLYTHMHLCIIYLYIVYLYVCIVLDVQLNTHLLGGPKQHITLIELLHALLANSGNF